jgi:hypothetical protein
MRTTMTLTLAAAALLTAASSQALAQTAATCKGKVAVDTVYQVSTGSGQFEYSVQLRNSTAAPIAVTLNFSGFPSNVSLFSPMLPNISLKNYATQSIKFGKGANAQINTGTVKVQYDTTASTGKPTVNVISCR